MGVGSGDLFGGTQRWNISEMNSVAWCGMTRRCSESLELQASITADPRDDKVCGCATLTS